MNTTHRPARIAAVLLVALVSWAIAAPLAVAAATPGTHTPKAGTPQVHWYRWHPTAHRFHKHYGSKVMIGVASMQDFKSLRVEYGFDLGTAHELPALHAVLVKVTRRAAPCAARARRRAIRASATSRRFTREAARRRACRTIRTSPRSTARRTLPYEWAFLATHVDRALDYHQRRPARRRRHHRHRRRPRARPRRQDRQPLERHRTAAVAQVFDEQRRPRTRHGGRLADRREHRRRLRHGRLRRRHARHRRPCRRRGHLQRHRSSRSR